MGSTKSSLRIQNWMISREAVNIKPRNTRHVDDIFSVLREAIPLHRGQHPFARWTNLDVSVLSSDNDLETGNLACSVLGSYPRV